MKFCSFLALLLKPELVCELDDDIWIKFSNFTMTDYENKEFYLKYFFNFEKIKEEINKINIEGEFKNLEKLEMTDNHHKEKEILKLPLNQSELLAIYSPKKCEECKTYLDSSNSEFLLCLICGVTLCKKQCSDSSYNIIDHSTRTHSGSCCFISLIKGWVYFVEFPLSNFPL